MCTGWKPVEIVCVGTFAPGQTVAFTVTLENPVTGMQDIPVNIGTNYPDAFADLPDIVEVLQGSTTVTFSATVGENQYPSDLYVSASCDGGTVYYYPARNR